MIDLPNPELRRLKAAAQHLALDLALEQRELVKVRLEAFKDQKRALARELAARSGSHLIMEVGHVVVLFRRRPAPAAETRTTAALRS
jgi:RNA-binding protein YhbY